jgi:hypothetical protein
MTHMASPLFNTLTLPFGPHHETRPVVGRHTPGLFQIVVAAIADSRRRRAEREIAAFIQRNGGRLTDSIERQIGEPAGLASFRWE